jgi:phosphoribosylaminoimidazole-succinocarboxamide synthase
MEMHQGDLIYEGKAKRVYRTDNPEHCVIWYKDSATAFNGEKKAEIGGKGEANCAITAVFFELLEREGVPTHFLRQLDAQSLLVKKVDIIPLEVIIRNLAAGSFSRRYAVAEGAPLKCTVLEFCYKRDDLGDPMINEAQILALDLAQAEELKTIAALAYRVNGILRDFLLARGVKLVDFKLEFGRSGSKILLADEVSPDTCRFWDAQTGQKLDKDNFRFGLGDMMPAYHEILRRIRA